MSFEGYYQMLCENGHLLYRDVYDIGGFGWEEDSELCKHCKAKIVFERLVDETNGEGEEVDLEVKIPPKTKMCSACGHVEILEPARYKIPKIKGE